MRAPRAARIALAFSCAYCLSIGALAAFAPHAFYDDFPFVSHWVDLLPPYNEHLTTDVGGLYLGFAVVFAWATWRPERTLALAVSTGFLLLLAAPALGLRLAASDAGNDEPSTTTRQAYELLSREPRA